MHEKDKRSSHVLNKSITEPVDESNNFIYLTLSLVTLLLASALSELLSAGVMYWVIYALSVATLVISYLSLHFGQRWRIFLGTIIILMLVSNLLTKVIGWNPDSNFDLILMLIFFIAATYSSARQVLFTGNINSNKIVGAVAIYLLLGLIWTLLYLLTMEFSPAVFNGIEAGSWEDNFSDVAYFSFVTLTTLGYGDITPTMPISRVLTYFEAIVGVFYIAIVVASLIGAVLKESKRQY
jgi:hypothetical protein